MFKMTTVSVVAQLTAVSKWLTSGHQVSAGMVAQVRSISCCMEMRTCGHHQDGVHPCYYRDDRIDLDQHFSRPMDRTQRICWVTPTIARFNPTWLFLVGLLEGFGVQRKASKTSTSSNFGGSLLVSDTAVSCATKLSVVILNAYTRLAESLSASAEVRNGLVC